MSHHVYMLRCSDGSLYTGSSDDVVEREKAHNQGKASNYTRNRRPVTLVYSEACENKTAAICRERQIKRWSRKKKEALIAGNLKKLKRLSKARK
jgi:tRNA/rRNA methyltransferase